MFDSFLIIQGPSRKQMKKAVKLAYMVRNVM
jgi:hypothetical protein